MMSFHVINLYMHEIATNPEDTPEWKQANTAETIRDALASDVPLTPAHINALSACLTAIDGIFEVFLSMEIPNIRCLPVFNFVRVAYAVVVLIKMYFTASSPKSELGKVINKDNMKVEQHLDDLLEKFSLTAADEKSRPASKFLVVLVMLRTWFQKQKGGGSSTSADRPPFPPCADYRTSNTVSPPSNQSGPPAQDPPPQPQQQQQQSDYSATANTPLQLLSEIATKDSNGTGSSTGPNPRPTPDFYWAGRQPQQPFMYDDDNRNDASNSSSNNNNNTSSATPSNTTGITPGADPAANTAASFPFAGPQSLPWWDPAVGFDYTGIGFGDGFAQAMDLTLAGIADGSMMAAGVGGGNGGGWDLPPPSSGQQQQQKYALQDPALLGGPLDGMGMQAPGTGGGAGGGGGGGGYQF